MYLDAQDGQVSSRCQLGFGAGRYVDFNKIKKIATNLLGFFILTLLYLELLMVTYVLKVHVQG